VDNFSMALMCSSRTLLVLLAPFASYAQFGGQDYTPPPPVCKPFKCPKGTKPAGNGDHQIWSYGCKDSGINVFSMANFNANDPLGGMKNQGKNVDKCCVERDICKQTCGTTSQECHNNFHACSKKICKGDQNCNLAAMMSDINYDPEEEKDKPKEPPEEFNYEKDRQKRDCRAFEKGQNASCVCVPDDDWQLTTDSNLKAFYRKHNPEKLDEAGEIKDIDDVWKKWKGKEPQMFQALAAKYKAKAVTIKIKPKPPAPPPYKPPPPLSKEEQEKEDKRMAEQREKWRLEDEKRDRERAERERKKAEEKAEEERRRTEEEEGETVEL